MTKAALLVFAALAVMPELSAGKKQGSRGGVARSDALAASEDVSEGFAGAEDLPGTDVTAVPFKEAQTVTALIAERSPVKEAGTAPESLVPHKRHSLTKREDDKDVSQGYAGAEDMPSKADEDFPAIVGQLPQSAEELPGLKDVEMVEEVEECILLIGVCVFFVLFGVFPALQQVRSNGKGVDLMDVALRFSLVQQALAVLGLSHHVAGIAALQQQAEREQGAKDARERARTAQVAARAPSYEYDDDTYERNKFAPSTGALLEEAFAEAEPAKEYSAERSLPAVGESQEEFLPAPDNVLDSLGLIDTEEPLL